MINIKDNFNISYRQEALNEILRILKPGGIFINGDRYAFDESQHQLEDTQNLIREWFRLFKKIDRMGGFLIGRASLDFQELEKVVHCS